MKFVSAVESSIKTHQGATRLGPKTLIIAGNKEGKSAIVNALEVALTGTASDVVGRALVKETNRLLSLSRDETLFAKVAVSATEQEALNEIVEWRTKGKKGSFIAQPLGLYNPATVFPLRMVREALAGAVESTRKFFIGFVAGGITDEDVLKEIPAPYHDAFRAVTTGIPRTAAVDLLLAGLGRAKERLTAVRAEIATRKDLIKESGSALPPLPSAKDYEEATAQIAALEVRLAELNQALGAAQANGRLQGQYTTLRARREELEQEMEALGERIKHAEANWPSKPTDADAVRPAHLTVLRFAAQRVLLTCPTCQAASSSWVTTPTEGDFWAERVASVEKKIAERAGVNAAFSTHKASLDTLLLKLAQARDEYANRGVQLEQIGRMPDSAPAREAQETAIGDMKADLDLARAQAMEMERTRAAWAPILKARDTAAEKEGEVDKWSRLIDSLKAAIGNLLDKGAEAFVARVQRHLPYGDSFALQLRDEDREVCRYGIMRDGKLHEALSGVEWAYVTAAIAAAAIPDSEKDKLHVIVFEDRSWDADTLRAVCTAMTPLEAQIIIATTRPDGFDWDERPLEGWTIVQLGLTTAMPSASRIQAPLVQALVRASMPAPAPAPTAAQGEVEIPKFIRDYIEAHPEATHVDLMREFKIPLNRALAIRPGRGGRKVKEKKAPEPRPPLPPELE